MLNSVQVTQRIEFSCCYVESMRFNIHRYRMEATVVSKHPENGIVIAFETLKQLMKSVVPEDNSFLFSRIKTGEQTALKNSLEMNKIAVAVLPVEILTAETLCSYLARRLQNALDASKQDASVINLKLRETNDSYANWTRPEADESL